MQTNQIKKLPQEIINQIAAGEVIERPASIVKELLDNSIDAGATEIEITVNNGGLDLIEIADNGSGIDKENLLMAFEPHATSKLKDINDLNTLITMGFRGEALSTIQSIAKVKVVTKTKDSNTGYMLTFNHGVNDGVIQTTATTDGTKVSVENVFFNIPARQKYLRSADTEFRKIVDLLTSYFLIHPEIHFKLVKDGKPYYNLPRVESSSPNSFHPVRIKEVMKTQYTNNLIDFLYDGDGAQIGGYVAHPDYKSSKGVDSFIFVNNRPILDKGIVKSVLQGFSRFIPFGEKVPFFISIKLNPAAVDVNVHPRKEEVRFVNPYRVYSAIEQAISSALKHSITPLENDRTYDRLREITNSNKQQMHNEPDELFDQSNTEFKHTNSGQLREVIFNKPSHTVINNSIEFSKQVLTDISNFDDSSTSIETETLFNEEIKSEIPYYKSIHQVFNKYIIVEFEKEMWVIDQHAAAERATFERLNKNLKSEVKNVQHLLLGIDLDIVDSEYLFLEENQQFFEEMGFQLVFDPENKKASFSAVPSDIAQADIQKVFREVFDLSSESLDLKNDFEKSREDIIATIACHSSVRAGQALANQESAKIYKDLMECENKYSCPHGRPAIWKQKIEDLDKHFLRTY
jgi:DNA mismatch repair protein MutL